MSEITTSDIDTLEAKADSNFALPADSRDAAVAKFLCQFYRGMVDPGFADKLAKDVADELRTIFTKEDAKAAGEPDKTPDGYPANPNAICDLCGSRRELHTIIADKCPGRYTEFTTGLHCHHCGQERQRHHAITLNCPKGPDTPGPVIEFATTHWSPKQ